MSSLHRDLFILLCFPSCNNICLLLLYDVLTSVKNIIVYITLSTFSLYQVPLELQQLGYLGDGMTTGCYKGSIIMYAWYVLPTFFFLLLKSMSICSVILVCGSCKMRSGSYEVLVQIVCTMIVSFQILFCHS